MRPSSFQFTDPSLIYIRFKENAGFKTENDEEIQIDANIEVKNNKISDNEYLVNLVLVVGKEENTVPFLVEAEMSAKFRVSDEIVEQEQVSLYLNQNAPALLTSYLRPIIAMVTNSSHYPVYNLPFINFAEEK